MSILSGFDYLQWGKLICGLMVSFWERIRDRTLPFCIKRPWGDWNGSCWA
jgi:hypothetical protein